MDFHGNNVHHIGYGHPRLKRAIAAQMDELPFAPRRYTCEPAVALARKLAAIAPGNLSKVLFTTGGSDAIEVAIKIARAATGRFKTHLVLGCVPRRRLRRGRASAARRCSARARSARCCRAPSTWRPSPAIAAPTATRPTRRQAALELCKLACARMVDYVLEREGDVAAVDRRAGARGAAICRRRASGRRCARPATDTARC